MASKIIRVGNGCRCMSRALATKTKMTHQPFPVKPTYQVQAIRRTSDWCDPHMNELPVPCGPWKEWYDSRQSFYMKHLIAGALWFGFSVFMVFYTDSVYFNFYPPERPGPPSDLVEECEEDVE